MDPPAFDETKGFLGEAPLSDDESKAQGQCWDRFTPKQALLVTLITNAIFTVSQFVGAILANSLALYGDSVDMAIDTATYALNWYVERERDRKGGERRFDRLEISVSLVSAVTLLVATGLLFWGGAHRLRDPTSQTERPAIVLMFSGVNLIIDIAQGWMFVSQYRRYRQLKRSRPDAPANFNLASAAVHVLADTMRTVSEMVAAQLSMLGGFDPVVTDAWCSYVVNVIVMMSGLALCGSVLRKWQGLHRRRDTYLAVSQELGNLTMPCLDEDGVELSTTDSIDSIHRDSGEREQHHSYEASDLYSPEEPIML